MQPAADSSEAAAAEATARQAQAAEIQSAVDANASFGIEEGEVDSLERKWITW